MPTVTNYTDPDHLRDDQYTDSSNLSARARLHERYSTADEDWFPWVFDQFDLPERAFVLELGCGPGYLWRENAGRIPKGWKVTLTDLSPGMVEEAVAALDGNGYAFEVVDARDIPFADGTFDAVVANHMLYHVPDRDTALGEIRRVLTPGGTLYAATNGREHMGELHDLAAAYDPEMVDDQPSEFRIESAGNELREHFESVSLRKYEDGLVVPDVDPIVAYVASGLRFDSFDEAGFREFVANYIETDGPVQVSKRTGLFVATAD